VTNPKGTRLETAIANYLIARGWPYAKRIPKGGARDKGDVTLGDGFPVTIQAKDRKGFEMAETQRGLKDQMHNADVPWGFAVHKKRGTTKVGEYYAVLPVDVMMDILEMAILNEQKSRAQPAPAKRKRVISRLPPLPEQD
jgi:hypothetical protein